METEIKSKLRIVSDTPHAEDDIMAGNPIRWRMNEIDMEFPCFSYRDFMRFRKMAHNLGLGFLLGDEKFMDGDLRSHIEETFALSPSLKEAYPQLEMNPALFKLKMHLFDEIGLPFYVMTFARVVNKDWAREQYNTWAQTKIHAVILELTDESSEIEWRLAMADYLAEEFYDTEMFKLLQQLIWLQHNIKKKRTLNLEKEPEDRSLEQRLSQRSLVDLESRQRKRLRLVHSS